MKSIIFKLKSILGNKYYHINDAKLETNPYTVVEETETRIRITCPNVSGTFNYPKDIIGTLLIKIEE